MRQLSGFLRHHDRRPRKGRTMRKRHWELHRTGRIGWLRAAVLGANDGIVSTASLVLGVAASHASHSAVIVAGMAGRLGAALWLGALAARAGGAPLLPGTLRVTFWGALAMAITAGVGALFGTVAA